MFQDIGTLKIAALQNENLHFGHCAFNTVKYVFYYPFIRVKYIPAALSLRGLKPLQRM